MKRLLVALLLVPGWASAATYYVDCNADGDAGAGTGTGAAVAWKTIAKVNGSSFSAGDSVLFNKGCTWYERIVPPSSGSVGGGYITFGAYGSGVAPRFDGKRDIAGAGSWTDTGGNKWAATISGQSAINVVLFAGATGNKQANTGALAAPYDWYHTAATLTVFSVGNPATVYGTVSPIVLSQGINATTKNYLKFIGLGVYNYTVAGFSSDGGTNIDFYYDVFDAGIAYKDSSLGLWLGLVTTSNIYNVVIARNYYGAKSGSGTGHAYTNCLFLANRIQAINASGANPAYSYSIFYANNPPNFTGQVSGGTAGAGNITGTWPGITSYAAYAAPASITIDDVGLANTDTFVDGVVTAFASRGVVPSISFIAGYGDAGWAAKLATWKTAGVDIASHGYASVSLDQLNSIVIRYVGAGTPATMTIAANTLGTAITGGPGGQELSLDLTNASYDTFGELIAYINGLAGVYTCTLAAGADPREHSLVLANVAGQDIKTANYTAVTTKALLVPDELSTSKAWLETNVAGLTVNAYSWPQNKNDATTTGYAAAAGYAGGRGTGALGFDTYFDEAMSYMANVQNIVSLSIGAWHGSSQAAIEANTKQAIFYSTMVGMPVAMFAHLADGITATELGYVLDAIRTYGSYATLTGQIAWIKTGSNVTGTSWSAAGAALNFIPGGGSPAINAGVGVGLTSDRSGTWIRGLPDIGAYEYLPLGQVAMGANYYPTAVVAPSTTRFYPPQ